ncbi:hypothetical protein AVEN_169707-1 [Araneus ventricosus]|uniref:Uncharacterized protein n=1 Tax=Araneus ventricosus TaxID=182803 RepID=A0A4Y2VC31_ARAVE|nr:hypothetical protein AVEN_169707-1 [Araneus ventricosus]
MKSILSLQKFQEDDTQVWVINCQQRNEPLFSRKIHSGVRNRPSPASVEWGDLRRDRAHTVKKLLAALRPDSRLSPILLLSAFSLPPHCFEALSHYFLSVINTA